MVNTKLIIIGGGAAGLMAACAAGQTTDVILLEKNDRVGRKLLTTGNGRCNLTNMDMNFKYYHSRSPQYVANALSNRPLQDTLTFFKQMGLDVYIEDGRVYPYSQTASSILDVLRLEIEHLGVKTITGCLVGSITYDNKNKYFILQTNDKVIYTSKKLIIACGGNAAPSSGSDGAGFQWLARFGHTIEKPFPALTPLVANNPALKSLKGIRVKPCQLTLASDKGFLLSNKGEVLFTEYGLSGIPAMQVSGTVNGRDDVTAYLDLLPDRSESATYNDLLLRRNRLHAVPTEHFFTGLFHKRVGQAVLKQAGLTMPQSLIKEAITDQHIKILTGIVKNWAFPVTGVKGFSTAQVTGGGARLTEFDMSTMQSLIRPDLYAAGEVLDAYGDCGGYNLHWAWTTGYLAGRGAASDDGGVS